MQIINQHYFIINAYYNLFQIIIHSMSTI